MKNYIIAVCDSIEGEITELLAIYDNFDDAYLYALKNAEHIASYECLCILEYTEECKTYYIHSYIVHKNDYNKDYVNDEYCIENGEFFIFDNDNEDIDYGNTDEVLKRSFKTSSLKGFLLAKRILDEYYDPILFSTDIKKLSEHPRENEDCTEYVILRCTDTGIEEEISNDAC